MGYNDTVQRNGHDRAVEICSRWKNGNSFIIRDLEFQKQNFSLQLSTKTKTVKLKNDKPDRLDCHVKLTLVN